MITLTTWEFEPRHGADEALETVEKLPNEVPLGSTRGVGISGAVLREVGKDA